MTKKDYIAVANILQGNKGMTEKSETMRDSIATDLADLFQKDNPRFDRDRFSIAAGVPSVRK